MLRKMECSRCVHTHGPPGCPASFAIGEDKDGNALCVFCADRVPCPVQRKIIAMSRKDSARWILKLKELRKSQEDRMTTPTTTTTKAPETLPAPRSCSEPGCERTLGPNNTSGKCQEHRSHTKSNGNGAVATQKTQKKPAGGFLKAVSDPKRTNGNGNGHHHEPAPAANGGNGDAKSAIAQRVKIMLDVIELPVVEIFAAIPEPDQQKLVEMWLTGVA